MAAGRSRETLLAGLTAPVPTPALARGHLGLKPGLCRQHEARMIMAAFERITTDDFGYCGGFDEPIPLPRLSLDATVTTCIECAR